VCKRRPRRRRAPLPLAGNATQRASPFTERKERDDRARVPGPASATAPRNTGPVPVHPWQGAWFMARDPGLRGRPGFVTAHTPGAPPGPRQAAPQGFFLPFGSFTIGTRVSNLKPGRWDLGPGLVGTREVKK
jgi:hypothetical protein